MKIHPDPEEILSERPYDLRLLKRLWGYLLPYWWVLLLSLLFLALTTGAQILGPYLTKVAIDRYIRVGDREGLTLIAVAYLASIICVFLFQFVHTYTTTLIGQKAMHHLRQQIFSHLLQQDSAFFDRSSVGRLMTRVIHDVETLNDLFSTGVVGLLGDAMVFFGVTVAMFTMEWRLATVTLALLPCVVWASGRYRRLARENYRQGRIVVARMNAFLAEQISGIATVKAFAQEERGSAQFMKINTENRDIHLEGIRYNALFFPFMDVVGSLTIGLILWYGGGLLLSGSLLPGVIVAFIQYVNRMFAPVRDLAEKYNILQAAMASSERIFALLDTRPQITPPPIPARPRVIRGEIEFRDVWFSYCVGEPVLRGVSFRVSQGERVAIVGPTGAGKTSIISTLLRFYDAEKGEIMVDGVDVRRWNPSELRQQISLVLQDPFLFSGSVAFNISLGSERISHKKIQEVARTLHADSFITRLPASYDEGVQERGAVLSQGERQILSMARALAFDRPILVLDEATSSVDTLTELAIQEALKVLLTGRTALIIAHRLSTIRFVDRILVVHRGEIREEGTHRELLARKGIYWRLYHLQFQGDGEGGEPL